MHPLSAVQRGAPTNACKHEGIDVRRRIVDGIVPRIVAHIRVGVPDLRADEFMLRPRARIIRVIRPSTLLQNDHREAGACKMKRDDRTRRPGAYDRDVTLFSASAP